MSKTNAIAMFEDAQARFEQANAFGEMVVKSLKNGMDIAILPGTKKPSLLLAGAEKVKVMLGLVERFETPLVLDEIRGGERYIEATIKCQITNLAGEILAEALGHKNSAEKNVERNKEGDNYDAKSNAKNMIIKMAEKRAFVSAVKRVASLSSHFTQDLDDGTMNIAGTGISERKRLQLYSKIYKALGLLKPDKKQKEWVKENIIDVCVKKFNETAEIMISSPLDENLDENGFKLFTKIIETFIDKEGKILCQTQQTQQTTKQTKPKKK